MPLVPSAELMKDAMGREYAVGAFNAVNMETAQAILGAAHAEKSPLILQVTQTTIAYTEPEPLVACIDDLISRSTIPVALHLDHGRSFQIVMQFLRMGFSSIMMDGSLQEDGKTPRTLEENLDVTRKAVDAAHALGASAEGEIGRLGQVSDDESEDILTDPEEAAQRSETSRRLWQAVGRLGDLYREVILLRYGHGCSYAEIAERLDLRLGTVKSRLNAAHRQLQSLLGDEEDPSGEAPGRRRRRRPLLLFCAWALALS